MRRKLGLICGVIVASLIVVMSISCETVGVAVDLAESEPEVQTDPLAAVLVDESFARCGGMYVRKKNGKLYAVQNIPRATWEKYDIGRPISPKDNSKGWTNLYEWGNIDQAVLSDGDVPLVEIEAGDELRGYRTDSSVAFMKIAYVGNTVRFVEDSTSYLFRDGTWNRYQSDGLQIFKNELQEFEVCDTLGNIADDYRKLDAGKEYLVSWFERTEYNEVLMKADAKFYVTEPEATGIKVEAELDKAGYGVFDTSALAPGIYRVFTQTDVYSRAIAVFAVK